MNAYVDLVDFMLTGMTPEQILAFKPSEEAQQRLEELLWVNQTGEITPDERAELNHHLEVESIVRLAKAKARKYAQNR